MKKKKVFYFLILYIFLTIKSASMYLHERDASQGEH